MLYDDAQYDFFKYLGPRGPFDIKILGNKN